MMCATHATNTPRLRERCCRPSECGRTLPQGLTPGKPQRHRAYGKAPAFLRPVNASPVNV
jgi:hypothetical protein